MYASRETVNKQMVKQLAIKLKKNKQSAAPSIPLTRSSPRNKKSSDNASLSKSAPLTSKLQTSKDALKMKVIKKFAIKNTSELQTPTKKKLAGPSLSPACRRTSPRKKKVLEDDAEPAQLRHQGIQRE